MTTDLQPLAGGELVAFDLAEAFEAFDAVAARFLQSRRTRATRATYGRALALYREHCEANNLAPLGGDAILSFCTAQNASRRTNGGELSKHTVITRLRALQSFLTWAHTFGASAIRPELVSELMTIPKPDSLSPRAILSAQEAQALLGAAEAGRDHLMIRTMLDAGLRVSELCGLAVGDVYAALGRYYLRVVGKGDKVRHVEIGGELHRELLAYARGRLLDPANPQDAQRAIFDLTRSNVYRVVALAAQRAGIDRTVSPHSLRHTHAHHMRLAGTPLEVVGDRLGHASLDTTKRYTRPSEMALATALPALPW